MGFWGFWGRPRSVRRLRPFIDSSSLGMGLALVFASARHSHDWRVNAAERFVAAALRAAASACEQFRHTHVLVDLNNEAKSLFGLDQISSFTVMGRPIGGLMALSARISGGR
jgi:hypothetical protein